MPVGILPMRLSWVLLCPVRSVACNMGISPRFVVEGTVLWGWLCRCYLRPGRVGCGTHARPRGWLRLMVHNNGVLRCRIGVGIVRGAAVHTALKNQT